MHYDNTGCVEAVSACRPLPALNPATSRLTLWTLLLLLLSLISSGDTTSFCKPCHGSWSLKCVCRQTATEDCSVKCQVSTPFLHQLENLPERDATELDLSGNLLTSLDGTSLDRFKRLKVLKLHGNLLTKISRSFLDGAPYLEYISLHDNPWHCGCEILELRDWLAERDDDFWGPEGVVCNSPHHLKGREVSTLHSHICEVSRKVPPSEITLHRVKRDSDNCFKKLEEKGEIFHKCEVTDFGGCSVTVTDDTSTVHFQIAVAFDEDAVEAECEAYCGSERYDYSLLYRSPKDDLCFCGIDHVECTDCQEGVYTDWEDGGSLCDDILYLSGTQEVAVSDLRFTVDLATPYSTNSSALITLTPLNGEQGYYIDLGDGYGTQKHETGALTYQYLIPGYYNTSMGIEFNPPEFKSLTVTAQDPPLFSSALTAGQAHKLAAVGTVLEQGTTVQLSWERTDVNGTTLQGLYCPPDWTPFRSKCLMSVFESVSYEDASNRCVEEGGRLLTLADEDELEEFSEMVDTEDKHYTGAILVDGSYHWAVLDTVTYFTEDDTSFTDSGSQNKDCVVIKNGQLEAASCSTTAEYTCEIDPSACPHGGLFNPFTAKCYLVYGNQSVDWHTAQTECVLLSESNGMLATAPSAEVYSNLMRIAKFYTTSNLWIGLSNENTAREWLWVDGSATDFSELDPPVSNRERCVALSTSTSSWRLDNCLQQRPFLCQYNAYETVSVWKHFAGSLLSGLEDSATHLEEGDAPSVNATLLYIFPDTVFSRSGKLQSWIFEASTLDKPTDFELQVYRPEPTEACGDEACSQPDEACPFSQRYCPFALSCLNISDACTCQLYPDSVLCDNYTTIYRMLGGTEVHLPEASGGLQKMALPALKGVSYGDVVAIQLPSTASLPIKCTDNPEDLHTERVYMTSQPNWIAYNKTVDISGTKQQLKVCNLMAVYTNPVFVEPPLNLVHPAISNYNTDTFHALVQNTLDSSLIQAEVLIYELQDFSVHHPCQVMQDSQTVICGIDKDIDNTLIFRVMSLERDIFLHLNATTEVLVFSTECPYVDGYECEKPSKGIYYYAQWPVDPQWYEEYSIAVIAEAVTGNIVESLEFVIYPMTKVSNLVLNVSEERVLLGVESELRASVTTTSDITWIWNVSGVVLTDQNVPSFRYNFTKTGTSHIQVTARNAISELTTAQKVTVFDTGVTNVDFLFERTGEDGSYVNVTVIATLEPYATGYLEVVMPNTSNLVIFFLNESPLGKLINTSFLHPFNPLELQNVTVNILYPVDNSTAMVFHEEIFIVEPLLSVEFTSNSTVENKLATDSVIVFNVTHFPEENVGKVYYRYDFGDWSEPFSSENSEFMHVYNESGTYNITVQASNNISMVEAVVKYKVLKPLLKLRISANEHNFITYQTKIKLKLAEGTGVTYSLNDGRGDNFTTQQEKKFYVVYENAGIYNVTGIAENIFGSLTTSRSIVVHPLDYFELNGILSSLYVPLLKESLFKASLVFHDRSLLTYQWTIDGQDLHTNQDYVSHVFNQTGKYVVEVNVSSSNNTINASYYSQEYVVEETLENLTLTSNVSVIALRNGSREFVNLSASLSQGSDYQIEWTYFDNTIEDTGLEQVLAFDTPGVFEVTLDVRNNLNTLTETVTVYVYEVVEGLHVDFNNVTMDQRGSLPSFEPTDMVIYSDFGTGIEYLWYAETVEGVLVLGPSNSSYYHEATLPTGEYLLHISAENPVSRVNVTIEISIQDVIQNLTLVSSPETYTRQDTVFSASLLNGSSVKYHWSLVKYNTTNTFELSDNTPSAMYSFNTSGIYKLMVLAYNNVSSEAIETEIIVYHIDFVEIEVNQKRTPYIPTNTMVVFSVPLPVYMIHPSFLWTLTEEELILANSTNEHLLYHFNHTGTFTVEVVATQGLFIVQSSMALYLEEEIENVTIILEDVVDNKVNVQDNISMRLDVERGSHLSYTWDLGDGAVVDGEAEPVYSYNTSGVYMINVTVWNNVSEVMQSLVVHVLDRITGLELPYCCDQPVRVNTEVTFFASIRTGQGTDVEFNWTVYDTYPIELEGQTVHHTFTKPGNYTFGVTASNGYSQDTYYDEVVVLDPITEVDVVPDRDLWNLYFYEGIGLNISFTAVATGGNGTDIQYEWFVNAVSQQAGEEEVFTFEFQEGFYRVSVVASNLASRVNHTLFPFQVQKLMCAPPVLDVSGPSERWEMRSLAIKIEVSVDNCNVYKTENHWQVFRHSCDSGELVSLPESVGIHTPSLNLPPRSLHYGTYCFNMTSSYRRTSASSSTTITVYVYATPLEALISGGSRRYMPNNQTFLLDGSLSYDPDDITTLRGLSYYWTCNSWKVDFIGDIVGDSGFKPSLDQSSEEGGGEGGRDGCPEESDDMMVLIPAGTLSEQRVYNFTLTVSAENRTNESTCQLIRLVNSVVEVSIECASCRENNMYSVSYGQHLKLQGSCSHCTDDTLYTWEVYSNYHNETIPLNENTTNSGADKPVLSIKDGVLTYGNVYTFSLSVTMPWPFREGLAVLDLIANLAPSGGTCRLSVEKTYVVAMEDRVEISCQNWKHNSQIGSQLIYHIYSVRSGTEWYPIYRGTSSNSTFFLSGDGEVDLVNLNVEVINSKNAGTLGLTSTVEVRAADPGNMSRSAYLLEVGSRQLSILTRQNNPKTLLQYVIALNLQLNAESQKSPDTRSDVDKRILLRKDMLIIMNDTLTTNAIDDVQQMIYVLMLITTFTDEFPAEVDKYVLVIRMLSLMITPLKDEVSPGMTGEEFMPHSILVTADNLLQIIQSNANLSVDMYRTLSEPLQALIETTLFLKLQTLLVEENPAQYTTDNIEARVQHVYAESVAGKLEFGDGGHMFLPEEVLRDMDGQGVFQIALTYSSNPNSWSLPNGVAISSPVINVYFSNTSTSLLNITGLDEPIQTELRTPVSETDSGQRRRRRRSTDVGETGVVSVSVGPGESLTSPLNVTESMAPGSVLHIKFEASTVDDVGDVFVSVYMAKGYQASVDAHDQAIDVYVNSDANYTVFLTDNFWSQESGDMYTMTVHHPGASVSVNVSIQQYVSSCQHYSPGEGGWSSEGCSVKQEYSPLTTTCLCHQLAMFGTTFSMAPAHLKFEPLTIGSVSPIIYIVASILVLLFLGLLPLCRHLDKVDLKHIRYVPLCGKDGLYKYEVTVITGRRSGAGTSSNVGIRLFGKSAKSENKYLERPGGFQRNCTDTLLIATQNELGDIEKVLLWHDNTGLDASWYVCRVIVRDLQNNTKYYFIVNSWLSVVKETNAKAGSEIQREISVAADRQLTSFTTRLTEELYKGLVERHQWLSVVEKPARNPFSRVQRLACCMASLCGYMLVTGLWYSLTHSPLDYSPTSSYLVWQDVCVGLLACVTVFLPVILITQVFRHSLPQENTNKISTKPGTAETVVMDIDMDLKPGTSRRQVIPLPADLSREDSEESSFTFPKKPSILRRTGNIHRVGPAPEPKQSQRLPVHSGHGFWSNENIIKSWPENIPSQQESRQTSAVSSKNTKRISVAECEDAEELIQELNTFEAHQSRHITRYRRDHSGMYSGRTREPSMVDLSMGSMVDMDYLNSRDTTSFSLSSSHPRTRKISHLSSPTSEGESMPDIAEVEPHHLSAPCVPVYGPNHHGLDDSGEDTDDVQYLPLPPPVRRHCFLPHCCVYLAYIFCALLCLGSLVTVFILAMDFGDVIPYKWLLATFMSFVFSLVFIEPLKVLVVAVCMAFLTSHLEQCEDQLYFKPILQSNEKLKDTRIRPVGGFSLLHAKEDGKKIRRIKVLIRQFVAYTLFLLLVLLINYASYNQSAFYYTSHIKNTFTKQLFQTTSTFSDIRSYGQYWNWLEEVAGPSFHNWNEYEDVVSGYNLGMVRLRQIRSVVKQCSAENAFIDMNVDDVLSLPCYGNPAWTENKETYRPSWEAASNGNDSQWMYSSADRMPIVGHMDTYSGGGYVQLLGRTLSETVSKLTELQAQNWLDRATRAVFVEWTEYSVGSPWFATGSILMEFPISGAAIPTIQVQVVDVLSFSGQMNMYMLSEVFLACVFIYLLIITILNIKESRWAYLKQFWNWMDLALTVLTLTSVAMYVHVTSCCTRAYNSFLQNRQDFTSFADAAHSITSWRVVNAVLLFFLMFVVVYQLRFIRFLSTFTRTIHSGCWKLLAIACLLITFLCLYSQLANLWYGHLLYAFHEVGLGMPSMLSLYRGSAGALLNSMFAYNPAFTLFFVMSFLGLVSVCVFGLSLAVVQDSYKAIKAEMMYHSTLETQDHEIVEAMLDRLKRWMGLKKEKPAFRRVKFLGEPSISSRNSSAKTLRSHGGRWSSDGSSESYSMVDEEMEEMNRAQTLQRMPEAFDSMITKLEQVVEQDEEETMMVQRIESQFQQQVYLQGKVPPKQPESVNDPSYGPFKTGRPRYKASAFPFNLHAKDDTSEDLFSKEPENSHQLTGAHRKEPKTGEGSAMQSHRRPGGDYDNDSRVRRKEPRVCVQDASPSHPQVPTMEPSEREKDSHFGGARPKDNRISVYSRSKVEAGKDYSFGGARRKELGTRVESARQSSQPLVPPVKKTRLSSSASIYGENSSTQRGQEGGTAKLRRPSEVSHYTDRDNTNTVRQVWEDT